jgi:hypothetical protein
VEFEVALAASTRPSDFELKMRTFRRHSTTSRKAVADPIAEPMTGTISLGVSSSAVTGAQPVVPPVVPPASAKTPESAQTIKGLSTGFDF